MSNTQCPISKAKSCVNLCSSVATKKSGDCRSRSPLRDQLLRNDIENRASRIVKLFLRISGLGRIVASIPLSTRSLNGDSVQEYNAETQGHT